MPTDLDRLPAPIASTPTPSLHPTYATPNKFTEWKSALKAKVPTTLIPRRIYTILRITTTPRL